MTDLPLLQVLDESRAQDSRRWRKQSVPMTAMADARIFPSGVTGYEKTLRPVTPGKTKVKAS